MRASKLAMKKIKIGLVEVGDSFGEQYYFPYSIGILRAYAEKELAASGKYEFLPIIYKRSSTEKYIENLAAADIIFYSTYLWNFNVSLEIARIIKSQKPEIINVFGGPQIPESNEKVSAFLRKYPFVEIVSFGEGEIPFLRIIERCQDRGWDDIPSIGYRRPDNSISFNEFKVTIQDINEIPSPYLSGIFDELIEQNPEEKWQGRIETNRGCPFACAFCYWGKKSERKLKQFDLHRIYSEIDWLSKNKIEFVFCCDANFGILKRDFDIVQKVSDNKKNFGYPKAFSVQNTKNSKERIFELQKILNDAGLQKGVNLALQSLNEETLKYIERSNIDNKTYTELQKLFTKSNIPTFTDLIIGLPGETYESFTNGVSEIIASGQYNRIQFINLTVLENTLMAEPEFQQKHGLKMVEAEFMPHHSSLNKSNKTRETHSLVIGANSMPKKDWAKTRVFSWMVSLLHFDKLLQLPFIILHQTCNLQYKNLFELFLQKDQQATVLTDVVSAFEKKALEIQNGGIEFCESDEWLNITWFPDELALIELSTGGKLQEFFTAAEKRLIAFAANSATIPPEIISQAILLNQNLMKQPFNTDDKVIECDYNLWEVYQAAIKGNSLEIEKGKYLYTVDRTSQLWDSWEDWCREVIWYGNKRGDYIYSVKRSVQ
jgi:radical SAM superfamily enzyme YgiQ (UPF0313 family)